MSTTTVSHVLSGNRPVRASTRAQVEAQMAALAEPWREARYEESSLRAGRFIEDLRQPFQTREDDLVIAGRGSRHRIEHDRYRQTPQRLKFAPRRFEAR